MSALGTSDNHQRVQTLSLVTLAAIATGAALVWLGTVLVPFVLAFFLSVALGPVVRLLARRLKVPIPLAFVLSSLVGLALLAAFGTLVARSITQLQANQEVYQANVQGMLDRIQASSLMATLGLDEWLAGASLQESARGAAQATLGSLASILVGLTSQGMLVLIFVMFLMAGSARGSARNRTLGDVERRIRGYVSTKMSVSAMTGIGVWLILTLLGVEMALVFGLFAFLLNFVPNVGSLVATLMPLPIVLLGDYSTSVQVLAIILPGGVQFMVGNWLEPKLLGDSMDLHPVTILLALIFWGMVWGLVGALLATPLTAIVRILLDKEEITRPVAELMAGRLPSSASPTPTEP
jgi:AI-2 transport protein TqsA